MGDEKIKMEAERAVYYNGELVSDASEHEEWLDSPEGDRLFIAMALRDIHKTLTPEQVKLLYFPEESVTLELRYFPAEPGPPTFQAPCLQPRRRPAAPTPCTTSTRYPSSLIS
jgi:hypothetical protein